MQNTRSFKGIQTRETFWAASTYFLYINVPKTLLWRLNESITDRECVRNFCGTTSTPTTPQGLDIGSRLCSAGDCKPPIQHVDDIKYYSMYYSIWGSCTVFCTHGIWGSPERQSVLEWAPVEVLYSGPAHKTPSLSIHISLFLTLTVFTSTDIFVA